MVFLGIFWLFRHLHGHVSQDSQLSQSTFCGSFSYFWGIFGYFSTSGIICPDIQLPDLTKCFVFLTLDLKHKYKWQNEQNTSVKSVTSPNSQFPQPTCPNLPTDSPKVSRRAKLVASRAHSVILERPHGAPPPTIRECDAFMFWRVHPEYALHDTISMVHYSSTQNASSRYPHNCHRPT